ncbi:MAG TPA: histidine--tRNA ligase [Thermoanaerobaculia bacterium]|nr:histidine--tRNA ligase [Thermoanaerobaculia bacterium]
MKAAPGPGSRQSIQSVKGMRDLLPPETAVWAAVEATARRVFASYGYGEIRTPVVEETELFVRGVGASTDIVGKEMYSFTDKRGKSLTLRPENTAPVARAYIEHGLRELPAPQKLFYIGPQFRYERPQRGRYRQFYQIGAELLGDPGPAGDGELLLMLVRFLRELGFPQLMVLVNTVGDETSRAAFREALRAHLAPHREALGEDSRRRLDTNPLRILDTKAPAELELLAAAPELQSFLSPESRDHFAAVLDILCRFEVPHRVEKRLVRGLDYYTRTVFEITAGGLGAQDAVVGGGRYDGLISDLGGPEVSGIGFAIGEDRLLDVVPESFRRDALPPPAVFVAAVAPVGLAEALAFAEELRQAGVAAVADLQVRPLKAALKRADRLGVRRVALLGAEELAAGEVTVRDLAAGEQARWPRAAAIGRLKEET